MIKVLKNRSENDIKNKWNSMQRMIRRKRKKKFAECLKSPMLMDAVTGLATLASDDTGNNFNVDNNPESNHSFFKPRDWSKSVEL